jgi:peptide deformylase
MSNEQTVTEPEIEGEIQREPQLDPEVEARRAAALARVRKFGDPALRTRARQVDRFDDALLDEVDRMGEIMDGALGVGLAAPQVGVLHRLLIYRVPPALEPAALVNPEIEWTSRDKEIAEEGCLSLPGVLVDVERPIYLRVRAVDEARVIQHEIDHLDGVLILDRTSREQRKAAVRALREAEAA